MPGMPRFCGWLSGTAPRAMSVVTTAAPETSTSRRSTSDAPARTTPPPTYSTGLRAVASSFAASRICLACGLVTGW
jgi:hypothetical protein